MTQSNLSRRQILRKVGIAGMAGLAGCSSLGSNDGTGDYKQWLLAPSEVAVGDAILLTSGQPNEIRSYSDSLPRINTEATSNDSLVPPDAIDHVHNFGWLLAKTGTFDAETVTAELNSQYEKSDTYRGYSLHIAGDTQAIGVADGTVLLSRSYDDVDAEQNLREFIDTGEGAMPRLQDASDAGAALVDNLGTGTSVRINTDADEILVPGAVMTGSAITLDDEKSEITAVVVFEESAAVDADRVKATVAQTAMFDSAEAVTVNTNSRTVVAQGTVTTRELQSLQITFDSGTAGDTPRLNATMDYRAGNGSGKVVITHNGGDAIPRERLQIRGSGFADVNDVDATSQGTWTGSASGTVDGQPAVVFGDTMTVGVTPAHEISLFVSSSRGSERAADSSGPKA